ncbi:hypothetical protein Clim_1357 [Chlorobium limicola DSM 245]|uniref:Uncharacterized protein n=1 Tax=Chlorobium limicola (strain DSM 245 / NBRC 103803 / 6330) TaxID=290315 RepID=B3ECZ2_CHLL2|nr:hypothetical protein Clim_1357 [Chlorobium limicola DSM 245]
MHSCGTDLHVSLTDLRYIQELPVHKNSKIT